MEFKDIKEYLLRSGEEYNTFQRAKFELELLNKNSGDEYDKHMSDCLLTTIALISKFGHSGGSMSIFKPMLNKLLDDKPLSPLTFDDEEWSEPYDTNGNQQNKRCSAFFKDSDGEIKYINDFVVSEDFILRYRGDGFEQGCGNAWHCRPIITENNEVTNHKVGRRTLKDITKYTTKTFKIEGVSIEHPKGNWTFFVDRKDLSPLYEFYDIELEDVDTEKDLPFSKERLSEIFNIYPIYENG